MLSSGEAPQVGSDFHSESTMALSNATSWRPPSRLLLMEPNSRRRTSAGRLCLSLVAVLLAVVVDVNNELNTGSLEQGSRYRYLLLAIPCAALLMIRLRSPSMLIRKPNMGDILLLALMAYGLLGSVYGAQILHTDSTGIPLFLPMAIAFLYLGTLDSISDREANGLIKGLAAIGLIYVVLNAIANSDLAPGMAESNSYRNAKVLFIAVGVAAALAAGQRVRLTIVIGLAAFVFWTYPAATSVVVGFSTIVTLFVTRETSSNLRPYLVGSLLLIGATISLANAPTTLSIVDEYFLAVGKQNNNETRLALFEGGIEKFLRSPVVGEGFTGETTLTVRLPSGQPFKAPLHDDYILLAASGGILALALFVAWIVVTEVNVLRRHHAFVAAGKMAQANLMRTLLVGFNAALVAALFNPVLQGMGRSASLFAFYGLMHAIGSPPSSTSARPLNPRVHRSVAPTSGSLPPRTS